MTLPPIIASKPSATLVVRLVTLGVALVVASLVVGLFAMTAYNRAHNEQMYVAATYLLTQGQRLYHDFAFVQMPYSVLTYALVDWITGGSYLLLKAKVVNWLWMLLAAGLIFWHTRRSTQDTILALLLLVLYFANYYLMRATIEASNYAMPLALATLAYVLWLRGVQGSSGRLGYPLAALLAGMALGGAAGTKFYYATLVLPFGVAALLYPRQLSLRQRITQGILPLAAGGVIALLPVAYYALRGWDHFVFNNLGFHALNAQWRMQNGFTDLSLPYKWETARDLIGNPNYLVLELWLAVAMLLGWAGSRQRPQERTLPAPGVWLAGSTAIVTLLTAFTPSPLFAQYFAMPIPFMLLWMTELYGALAQTERWTLLRLAGICALVGILVVLPRHTQAIHRLVIAREPWSGVVVVEEARQIRQAIDTNGVLEAGSPARLATLSPIVALEGGISIYPELATGSFLMRVGDLLSPAQRAHYVATSPSTLASLLDAAPPAAILIGDEGDAETPLRAYAEAHGYVRADFTLKSGELWLRPAP